MPDADAASSSTFTLVYAGEVEDFLGKTRHRWILYLDGEQYGEFQSNKPGADASIKTMAAVRISLESDREVAEWRSMPGEGGQAHYQAILTAPKD